MGDSLGASAPCAASGVASATNGALPSAEAAQASSSGALAPSPSPPLATPAPSPKAPLRASTPAAPSSAPTRPSGASAPSASNPPGPRPFSRVNADALDSEDGSQPPTPGGRFGGNPFSSSDTALALGAMLDDVQLASLPAEAFDAALAGVDPKVIWRTFGDGSQLRPQR